MKRLFAVLSLILVAAVLSSCGSEEGPQMAGADHDNSAVVLDVTTNAAETSANPKRPTEVIYDEISYDKEQNAELAIMRVGDKYITYSKGGKAPGWTAIYDAVPDEIKLDDGGFGLITADITRVSGGEPGYFGNPRIDKIISFSPMTLTEAKEYADLQKYDPGNIDTYCHDPRIYDDYLIVYSYPEHRVYRDGKLVGTYKNIILAQGAMGLIDIDLEGIEIEDYASSFMYIICIGDTYYGYLSSISANYYFTPLLDRNFRNKPDGIELSDGETVRIRCDYSIVNGGKQGYVNAPLIRTVYEVEDNDYDSLTRNGMTPLSEQTEEIEDHADGGAEALFERNGNTWLIFRINGVYYVYADNYEEIHNCGEYLSLAEVRKAVNSTTT